MFEQHLLAYAQGVSHLAIVIAFLWIAKKLSELQTDRMIDLVIEEDNNLAVSLRQLGLYVGIAIGMVGAITGPDLGDYETTTKRLLVDGALVTSFLLVAKWINDHFILPYIDNDDEVFIEKNLAVGIIEFGGYFATGLIAYGSMSGEGGPWWSSVPYFFLGQTALLVFVRVYERFVAIRTEVKKGNAAAGVLIAGMLTAYGFILSASIAGPFMGWMADLESFGTSAVVGIILVLVLQRVVDKLFLPTSDVCTEVCRDQNIAAVLMVSGIRIVLMLVISHTVI